MNTNLSKYDISGFMEQTGFDINETYEVYSELIGELESSVAELLVASKNGNIEEIRALVHNLKGVTGNYKISDAFECAKLIDSHIKAGEDEKALEMLKEFIDILLNSQIEIKKFFNK